jgi:PKD repeat protein
VDFGVPGTYPYTLTVQNCSGANSDTYNGEATVDCCLVPDNAAFTYNPADPIGGETIVFTGTATGSDPLAFDWAFGDGATASGAVVSHAYAVGGSYTVAMTASNSCGTDSVQQVLDVCTLVTGAGFNWTPITPTAGDWVAFHGTASGSTPITYAWDFGDGGSGSGANTSHRYTAAGLYTVVLTASNCGGVTSVETHEVQVLPEGGCDTVGITDVIAQVDGCAVDFSATLTGDLPYTYLWAFGDGATSALAAPTHTYTQTGTYSATLEAWNCSGAGHDTYAFAVDVTCAVPPSWSVYLPIVWK